MQCDMLGDGPDFTFLQPYNQCGSPYSPGSVSRDEKVNTDSPIFIRALWIMDLPTYEKCLHHSSKTQKIIYDKDGKHPFCIYRSQHVPWEYRNCIFE